MSDEYTLNKAFQQFKDYFKKLLWKAIKYSCYFFTFVDLVVVLMGYVSNSAPSLAKSISDLALPFCLF